MSGGHYQMHRGWMDNTIFRGKYCRAAAWVWLIENAAWQPRRFDIKGKTVTVERGQLVASIRYMASAWRWNRGAVDRYLTRLKTETMIVTSTVTGETVITICNYERYQTNAAATVTAIEPSIVTGAGQHRDSTVTGAGQNKEGKESKEGKEGNLLSVDDDLKQEFLAWWNEYPNKSCGRSNAEKSYLKARKKGVTQESMLDGLRRYKASKPDWQKWAHATTWLNQSRWEAEYEVENGKSGNGQKRTTAERRREQYEGLADAGRVDHGPRTPAGHNA